MKIVLFYRKKNSRQYSIERVYNSLKKLLESNNEIVVKEVPFKSKGIIRRLLNGLYCWIHQSEINHITGDINYVGIFLPKRNTVLTIHDIYPLVINKGIKRYILKKVWYEWPIKRCKKVVFVSQFTKDEVLKIIPLSDMKWEIIENPIPDEYHVNLNNRKEPVPTILQVGIKKNKNLQSIIQALKGIECKLNIVGRIDPTQEEMLRTNGINYDCYDALSNQALFHLYVKSDLVLFVSTYEGFGLPIIEAQMIGRPVITSNITSMPEVAGSGALLVNPNSVFEIRESVIEVLNNEKLRSRLISDGFENVKRFDPKIIVEKYKKMYESIMDKKM